MMDSGEGNAEPIGRLPRKATKDRTPVPWIPEIYSCQKDFETGLISWYDNQNSIPNSNV